MNLTVVVTTYHKHIKYFNRCLSSIKFPNIKFEVLVVLDSFDKNVIKKTEKIINKSKFKDIKLLINKKKGISNARNLAIKSSNNQWITFIDGDDYFVKNKINKNILKNNYDLIIFNSKISSKKASEFFGINGNINNKKKVNLIKKYLNKPRANSLINHVWSKFFNLNFLKKNKIKFDKNISVNEDFLFSSKCIEKARKILVKKKIYMVYHNQSSQKKTAVRHIETSRLNYQRPINILANKLNRINKKIFKKKALNYWEEKISHFKKNNSRY